MSRLPLTVLVTLCLATAARAQTNEITLPNTSGESGQVLEIQLQSNFDDAVTGLTFSLLFDPNVLEIQNVALIGAAVGFVMETNLSAGRLRVALAGADAISGAGPVLRLTTRLIGPPGTASMLDLASVVLNEGADDIVAHDGLVTIVRLARITGSVVYREAARPVAGAVVEAVDLADGTPRQVATDAGGGYALGPMPPGDYLIEVTRTQVETGAIDPLDVSDILRHLVGTLALSDDELRAADVSGNGRAGTTDASLILRYIVGIETQFPAGPLWQFEPAGVTINLLTDEIQGFTSFLLGDVNGNWEESAPAPKPLGGTGPQLRFGDILPHEADLTRFTLKAEDVRELLGGQLRLVYDPLDLEVTSVKAAELTTGFLMAANLTSPGEVIVAFAGSEAVDGSGPLLFVDFRELGQPGATTPVEIESAALNNADLTADALAETMYVLGTAHGDVPTAIGGELGAAPAAVALAPNSPNPFNCATVLGYSLAEMAQVELAIHAMNGHLVRRLVHVRQAAGDHSVVWDGRDAQGVAAATGVYLVRLRAGDVIRSRPIMLLR